MYIVVIAWLFVALIIAISQASVIAAILSFVFWGLVPLGLILWLLGTPERRRRAHTEKPASPGAGEAPKD